MPRARARPATDLIIGRSAVVLSLPVVGSAVQAAYAVKRPLDLQAEGTPVTAAWQPPIGIGSCFGSAAAVGTAVVNMGPPLSSAVLWHYFAAHGAVTNGACFKG